MTAIESLRLALTHLDRAGAKYALVGGLAVSVRAEPRFTRDADLAIAVSNDAEAEALVHSLVQEGYRTGMTVEQEATGRLASVRLTPDVDPESSFVDLLFASSSIEPEVVAGASLMEVVPDLFVPVAALGHLIAMKALSEAPERFQDSADLVSLLRSASSDDLVIAADAIALIQSRGANRGKDLAAVLLKYRDLANGG